MANPRAAVIGASGLVGRALLRALERHGYEVHGTYAKRVFPALRRLDITDGAAVANYLTAVRPDLIFLPGALTNVDYCEDHSDEASAINAEGPGHAARAAARLGSKIVFYSTDYVFDGGEGPYDEAAPARPISVYGRSKLAGERAVAEAIEDHLIVRTTVVYGWERTSENFAMQVHRNLSAARSMRVAEDQLCTPTLADYLAEASIRLAQQGARGIVNVAGRDLASRTEFGRALARLFNLDPDLIVPVATATLSQRARRPLRAGLKTDKLKEMLGTEAMPLEEALKRLRRQWRGDTQTTYAKATRSGESAKVAEEIFAAVRKYYGLVHKEKEFIPFKTPVSYAGRVFDEREMVNLVDSALDFWLTLGPYGDLFEEKLKSFFAARDFVFVNSGSSANLVAVSAMMSHHVEGHLTPGDEVVTPAVTFPSTLAPIIQNGLVPVFVDAEVGTYNVNPELIEEALSERTKAIVVPHTLGNPCDMDAIGEIARRRGLFLIEDCCDALGSTFGGKLVGTFGEMGTLSFFPAHHITTGEGGGVIVNRALFSRVARSLRDWGRDCWCAPGESNTCSKRFGWQLGELPRGYDHKYVYSHVGYNLKPTDLQAAVGAAQAERIADFVAQRRRNFRRFYEALAPYQDRLILPREDSRSEPSWFGFPITVAGGVAKAELVQWLEAARIETRAIFGGNILRQPGYQGIRCRVPRALVESDRIMQDSFFIGVYPGLSDAMIDFVVERFRSFFAAGVRR
jgi:CDP-6-deoxy-D-xylo-4-hexulose-3-dehydrase